MLFVKGYKNTDHVMEAINFCHKSKHDSKVGFYCVSLIESLCFYFNRRSTLLRPNIFGNRSCFYFFKVSNTYIPTSNKKLKCEHSKMLKLVMNRGLGAKDLQYIF
jgi:hypothetical protein